MLKLVAQAFLSRYAKPFLDIVKYAVTGARLLCFVHKCGCAGLESKGQDLRAKVQCVTILEEDGTADDPKVTQLITLLGTYSEQWKSASVMVQNRATSKALYIQHRSQKTLGDLWALQGCRQLQNLCVHSYDHETALEPELKFANLRVLSCTSSALGLFLELPVLEELDVNTGDKYEFDFNIIIDLPKMMLGLQRLDMHNLFRDPMDKLVEYLTVDPNRDAIPLPKLQHIRIRTCKEEETYPFLELVESHFPAQSLQSIDWTADRMSSNEPPEDVESRLEKMQHQGLKARLYVRAHR
ncbi:hypothetical protein C8J56DRAFT_882143 [Mycena floridula]|nr:hypothetical protein C8J56DRAFT_882143 [Mycena floridula]